jgi:hypothetical protein
MSVTPQPWQLRCATWLACMARLTVLHTEHCTDVAPRKYMSNVRQPPHTSCAISVPVTCPRPRRHVNTLAHCITAPHRLRGCNTLAHCAAPLVFPSPFSTLLLLYHCTPAPL